MIAVWSIVLGGSLVVFAALIAVVFPRIFLKEGEIDTPPSDRGLKKVKEPNGKSILFEPSVEMRKYVRQYILSERGEKKVIVCRLDEEISYLDYDILLFDCLDRMLDSQRKGNRRKKGIYAGGGASETYLLRRFGAQRSQR